MALVAVFLSTPTLASAQDDWSWTGLYVGAFGAYTDADVSAGPFSIGDTAGSYGLNAGYNYSVTDSFVLGAELSYSTAEYEVFGLSGDVDTTRVKFKAGYGAENAIIYGVLGYVDLDGVDDGVGSENGVTYGIGYSFKATKNIVVTGEILQDSADISGVDVDINSVSLGVSYQF